LKKLFEHLRNVGEIISSFQYATRKAIEVTIADVGFDLKYVVDKDRSTVSLLTSKPECAIPDDKKMIACLHGSNGIFACSSLLALEVAIIK
jgi:hypothetical protein